MSSAVGPTVTADARTRVSLFSGDIPEDIQWNSTTWILQEMLEGVRLVWDPTINSLVHATTTVKVYAPEWFTEGLGTEPLDIVLWTGRGKYRAAEAIAKSSEEKNWKHAFMMIQDHATFPNGLQTRLALGNVVDIEETDFQTRWSYLALKAIEYCRKKNLPTEGGFDKPLRFAPKAWLNPAVTVSNGAEYDAYLDQVRTRKGAGVIVRGGKDKWGSTTNYWRRL